MIFPLSLRRRLAPGGVAAFAIAIASCDNSTSGLRASNAAAFAFKPTFVSGAAMRAVPVARVRVFLARPGVPDAPALDTTITYPAGQDSLVATFDVPILSLTGREKFDLNLAMMSPQGDTVFKGTSPVTLNVQKAGDPPPEPAPVPLTYVGPGKDATQLRVSPRTLSVNFGDTVTFTSVATNSAGTVVSAPVTYRVVDTTMAKAVDLTSGRIAGKPLRGTTLVIASTLTGQADTASLVVKPIPASMKITSGNNQSAAANTELTNDLVVQVLAADSVGMPGTFVRFSVPPTGGQLTDTVVTTDANGFARTRLRVGTTAGAVSVTASMSGAGGAPFTGAAVRNNPLTLSATITHGPAAKLVFTAQPTNVTAGALIAPSIVVTIQDAFNNTATSFTGSVALSLTDSTARAASVTGTASVTAVAGVATFSLARIERANTRYTLRAASGSLASATSAAFDVLPGAAAALAFRTQPARIVAGLPFTPAVAVEARDAFGNLVPSFTGTVKFAPTAGVGTTQEGLPIPAVADSELPRVTAIAGVATFPNTGILKDAVRGVSITATSGALTAGVSDTFSVVHAAAHHLAFTTQPVNGAAGGNLASPEIVVEVHDQYDNRVLTSSDSVFLAPPPSTGTLSGTTRVRAVEGRARFTTVSASRSGTYSLFAQGATLQSAASAAIIVSAGAATGFTFIRAASTTAASGQPLATQPILQLVDAFGNFVSLANRPVTVTTGGATVTGTPVTTNNTGRATFTDLTLSGSMGARTLTYSLATPGGATVTTTSSLTITAGAADAGQSQANVPATATAGNVVTSTVGMRDASGNPITTGGQPVAASVTGSNAGRPVTVTDNGNGTFTITYTPTAAGTDNLQITLAGTAIGGAHPITVSAASASAVLIVTQPPATIAAGATMSASTARLVDGFGNVVRTSGVPVTVSISTGGGTLGGTTSVNTDVDGVASFTTLSIGGTIGNRTLRFDSPSLTSVQSSTIAVSAGAASAAQSGATVGAGTAGSVTTVVVQARDAFGNLRTTSSGVVSASVSGANTVGSVGVVDNTNGTYTLTYTPTASGTDNIAITLGGTAIGGSPFTSVVTAGNLHHFAVLNSGGGAIGTQTAGGTFGLRLIAQDANNNTVTSFTSTVDVSGTLALASGSGTTASFNAGVLLGHAVRTNVAGTMQVNVVRTGGTEAGSSNSFTVSAGSLDHFDIQAPGGGAIPTQTAGAPFTVQVLARDQFNNTASAFTGTVTLTSPSADLVGAPITTANFVGGILASQSLTARSAGAARTLGVTDGAAHTGTSNSFTVNEGAADASQTLISATPSSVPADGSTAIAITVQLRDAFGNNRTSGSGTVALSSTRGTITNLADNGNGTWSAQLRSTSAGTATISGTLNGSAIASSQNVSFSALTANASNSLATVPANGVSGSLSSIQVIARNALNQPVSGATVTVSVSGANAVGALSVTDQGNGNYAAAYTPTNAGTDNITVTVNGTAIPGSPFASAVATGTASASTTTANVPSLATAGGAVSFVITTRDAAGNLRSTSSGASAVSVSVSGANTLAPTSASDAGNGTYTFSYTPTASGTDNVAVTLNGSPVAGSPFTVAVSAAGLDHFAVVNSGGGAIGTQTAGGTFGMKVIAQDANNNTVTSFNGTVAVSATLPLVSGFGTTAAFNAGVLLGHAVRTDVAGTMQLLVTNSGGPETGSSNSFTVLPGSVDHFDIQAPGGGSIPTQTAGAPFTVQVLARDQFNNTASGFTGTVTLTSPNADLVGAPITTANFVSGILPTQSLTARSAGTARTLAVSDGSGHSGTSSSFTVNEGAADASQTLISATPSSVPADGSTAIAITVQLRDALGNNRTSSGGTVALSSTRGTITNLTNNNNGTWSAQLTSTSAGSATVSGTLDGNPIASTQNVTFSALTASASNSSANVPAGTAGSQTVIQVIARNAINQPVPGATVAVSISGTNGAVGALAVTDQGGGNYSAAYTPTTNGTDNVTVTVNGSAIPGSPFASIVSPGAASAGNSAASVPSSVTAGSPVSFQVITRDIVGNDRTSGSGPTAVSVVVSGANTVTSTFATDLGNGRYSFNYTPTVSGTDNVAITLNGSAISGSPYVVTVGAGSLDHFSVERNGGGAIPGQAAGVPFALRITARDQYNNVVTAFNGSVNVSVSSGGATLSGGIVPGALTSGVLDGLSVTITDVGTGTVRLGAANQGGSETGTSNSFSVTGGGIDHFDVSAPGGGSIPTQVAGVPFNIQVIARDAFNNTAASFNGTATLTSVNADVAGAPVTTSAFVNGVLASQPVTARAVGGGRTLSVSDGSGHTGTSAGFSVVPGSASAATSLINAAPSSVPADGSSTISVTVQLRDAFGNNLTSSSGTVVLSSTRGTITGLTNNANGTWSAQLTSTSAGSATISGTLDGNAMTSTQNVTFSALTASASNSSATVPPTGTAGSPTTIQVVARNGINQTVSGAAVSVSITGANGAAGSLTVTDQGGGNYSAVYTPTATGTDNVTVRVNGTQIPGSPFASVISAGTASASTTTAVVPATGSSGTPVNITITTRDANGNVRTTSSGANAVSVTTTGFNFSGPTFANDNGNGTYSFSYTPLAAGTDHIAITLNGSAISGSPYSVAVGAGSLDHFMIERTGGGSLSPQTAGVPFNLRISARDIEDNLVSSFTGTVSVSVSSGGATLTSGGGVTASFVSGEVPAHSVTVGNVGTGSIQLSVVRSGGSESGQTGVITVNGGSVDHFDVSAPGGGAVATQTAGVPFNIQVIARDVFNNTASGFNSTVTLTSANADVAGAPVTTGSFLNGILASQAVTARSAGATRTLSVSDGSGHTGTSAGFTVVSASASASTSLISASPASVPADGSTAITVTVQLRDAFNNNRTTSGGTVTLSTTRGTITGLTDNGNGTWSAQLKSTSSGAATISGTLDGNAMTSTQNVSFSALTANAANSSATVPSTGVAGSPSTITVIARNALNQPVAGATVAVSVSGANASAGSLTVTDQGGGSYSAQYTPTVTGTDQVTVTVNGSQVPSSPFTSTISAGTASASTSTADVPSSVTAGSPVSFQVTTRDAAGNLRTSSAGLTAVSVSVSGANTAGAATATDLGDGRYSFSYTPTVSGADNVAITLNGSAISGSPYVVTVGSNGLDHFSVERSGAGTITSQSAGAPFSLRITARDQYGNLVTSFTGNVNVSVSTGGGTLSSGSGATASFAGGVLDPHSVTIGSVGTGTMQLGVVRVGGSEAGTSNAFNVSPGSLDHFEITTAAGTAIPSVNAGDNVDLRIVARDVFGNVATSFSGSVDLNSANANLAGAPIRFGPFTSGVYASATVMPRSAGSNRTITASEVEGGHVGSSNTFTVIAGSPNSLHSTAVVPSTGTAGTPTVITVQVRDLYNNALSSSGAATLAAFIGGANNAQTPVIQNNGDGTFTVNYTPAVAGTDFIQIQLDGDGAGPTPPGGISGTPFTSVVSAAASPSLQVQAQPSASAASGFAFGQQPVIRLKDANGDYLAQSGVNVTVAILSQPGEGASLLGTTTVVTDNSGTAIYSNLGITGLAGDYVLQFTAPGFTSVSSQTVTVVAGVAAALEFVEAPPAVFTVGESFEVKVKVADASENGVSGILVTLGQVDGTFSFDEGVTTMDATTDAAGIATFAAIKMDGPGGPYHISFSINPGYGVSPLVSGDINQQSPPSASNIQVVTGDSSYVNVNETSGPVTVRVLDGSSQPLAGVPVHFLSNFVTPSDPVLTTNASGEVTLTLSPTAKGIQAITACIGYEEWEGGGGYNCNTLQRDIVVVSSPAGTTHTWKVGLVCACAPDWNDPANWAQGSVPTSSSVVYYATGLGPALTSDVTIAGWQAEEDTDILSLGGHTLTVTGRFLDEAGFKNGKLLLTGGTTGSPESMYSPWSSEADLEVTGVYNVTGHFVDVHDLVIKENGRLIIGEHEVDVERNFATLESGTVQMTHADAYLFVNDSATFAGGDERGLLETGTLDLYGNLHQVGVSSYSFTSGGDFELDVEGETQRSHIRLDNPNSVIQILIQYNAHGVELEGDDGAVLANIGEFANYSDGGVSAVLTTNTSTGIVRITKDLSMPDFANNYWLVPVTYADGAEVAFNGVRTDSKIISKSGHTLFNDVVTSSDVIADGGMIEITGTSGSQAANFSTINGGRLKQASWTTFYVDGNVSFEGGSLNDGGPLLSAGVLQIGGGFTQVGTGAPDAFAAASSHVTRFTGTSGEVYFDNPGASHFGTVEFAGGSGNVLLDSDIAVNGTLRTGGPLGSTGVQRDARVVGDVQFDGNVSLNKLTLSGSYQPGEGLIAINTIQFDGFGQVLTPVNGGYPNVEIVGTASTASAAVSINGYLWLGGYQAGHGSLQLETPLSVGGTVLVGADTIGVSHFGLAVGTYGILRTNGNKLTVGGAFETRRSGKLEMASASGTDSLIVAGELRFKGASTDGMLTKGVIDYAGNFEQSGSVTAFAPSGEHRVVWNGFGNSGSPKTISFAHPGVDSSHFNRFQVRGTDAGCFAACTVKLGSSVVVKDSLILDGPDGGQIIDDAVSTRTLHVAGYVETPLGGINVRNLALGHAPPPSASLVADTIQYRNTSALDELPQLFAGYSNTIVVVKGTINSARADQTLKGLIIAGNGQLELGPHTLNITNDFETRDNGVLVQRNNDPLIVHGNVKFDGGQYNDLSSGYIDVYGNFAQGATTTPYSFSDYGSHYVRLVGSAARTISFASPDTGAAAGSRFRQLAINTTNATITMNSVVPADNFAFEGSNNTITGTGLLWLNSHGNLHVQNTSTQHMSISRLRLPETLVLDGSGDIRPDTVIFTGDNSSTPQGDLDYKSLRITATMQTVVPNTGLDIENDLIVEGGWFNISQYTVTVGGNFYTFGNGELVMNASSAALLVSGGVSFQGTSTPGNLTDGRIDVGGNFLAGGSSTFRASSVHTVRFTGANQTVSVSNSQAGLNQFGRVDFRNQNSSLSLTTNLYLESELLATANNLSNIALLGNGHTIRAGGLNVNDPNTGPHGVVNFDNLPIIVRDAGRTIDNFNRVTFTGFASSATQLTVTSGDTRGSANPLWSNVNFQGLSGGATGKYLDWTQTGTVVNLTMSGTNPASRGGFATFTNSGGTVNVSGWPP